MKYKSKNTGEVISKELFNQIDHFTCQSSEDYFEPVYEVGDWVITKNYSEDYDGKPIQIRKIEGEISTPEDCYVYYERINSCHNSEYSMIDRLATPKEIESAIEKFSFEYLDTYLTKSAWQQIGIRKGWTL